MDRVVKLLREAGYTRTPRRRPAWLSDKDWAYVQSVDWPGMSSPIYHIRISPATARGLRVLGRKWGTRIGDTLERLVDRELREDPAGSVGEW